MSAAAKEKKAGSGEAHPPDRRSLREAKRFALDSERLLKKHKKKVTKEQRERVDSAVRGVRELLDYGPRSSEKELAAAVKNLDQVVEEVLGFAKKSPRREFFESIAVAILIAAVLRAFVIEAFKIPSGSMIPTLEVGDYIFVNKFIYGLRIPLTNAWIAQWGGPARGDVIVFRYPMDTSIDFIKRVVAVAGDRVRVEQRDVFVNGVALPREPPSLFTYWDDSESEDGEASPGERRAYAFREAGSGGTAKRYTVLYAARPVERPLFPASDRPLELPGLACRTEINRHECVVLPGYIFAMGDNRDNSKDSRFWGGVPIDYVKGRAMFVWWSRAAHAGIRWKRLFTRID